MNPLVRPLSGRVAMWSLIEHRGRRSGTVYRTPVSMFPTPGGVAILLAYGDDRDWVRNLVAAGGGRAAMGGKTFEVTDPRIVAEAAGLSQADRRALDAEMCANHRGLTGLGNKRITATARSIAYRLDSQAAADRARRAPQDRRVSVRPAPDGMSYLTAVLPMPHATSVHAALNQATDTAGDGRLRGHVMADTLVERITGRPADAAVSVAVNVVITDDTLLAGNTTPARVPGYGPVPASIARQLVTTALWDARSRVTLRRLYRHPSSGALVAMQSRARLFPTSLATFIDTRDDVCRTP